MTADLVWTIVGTVAGVIGLAYGLFESYRARKLKDVLKTITKTYPRCCRFVSTCSQKLVPSLSDTYMPSRYFRPSALMPRILYTHRLMTRPSSLTL